MSSQVVLLIKSDVYMVMKWKCKSSANVIIHTGATDVKKKSEWTSNLEDAINATMIFVQIVLLVIRKQAN